MPCAVLAVKNYFQESFVNKYTRKNRGLFFPFRAEFALRFTLFEPLAVSSSIVFNRVQSFRFSRGQRGREFDSVSAAQREARRLLRGALLVEKLLSLRGELVGFTRDGLKREIEKSGRTVSGFNR